MDHDRLLRAYRSLLSWYDSWEALAWAFLLEDLSKELEVDLSTELEND